MLVDSVAVEALPDFRIRVSFEDGSSGTVDVREMAPFRGVFARLADEEYFSQVRVNREVGCVEWPGGEDLDPIILHALATGSELPADWASLR